MLEALVPDNLAQARGIVTYWRVLGFSVAISLLTGVVFGLLPALQVSRPNLTEALKEGGQSSAGGESSGRLRGGLVIGEIALSLVLLAGAGLLLKSFYRLTNVDPGFQPEQALTMRMQLSGEKYGTPVKRQAFYDQMLRQLQALPGVQAAAVITQLPLTTTGLPFSFSLEGEQPPTCRRPPSASSARIISARWASRCCAGAALLRRTPPKHRRWSSSTGQWPNVSGRVSRRWASGSRSARPTVQTRCSRSSVSLVTCGRAASSKL